MHEAPILYVLYRRYLNDVIYTNVTEDGRVLLSINPYKVGPTYLPAYPHAFSYYNFSLTYLACCCPITSTMLLKHTTQKKRCYNSAPPTYLPYPPAVHHPHQTIGIGGGCTTPQPSDMKATIPHIFTLANTAYRGLVLHGRDQVGR